MLSWDVIVELGWIVVVMQRLAPLIEAVHYLDDSRLDKEDAFRDLTFKYDRIVDTEALLDGLSGQIHQFLISETS
jgi:hypothetical protein